MFYVEVDVVDCRPWSGPLYSIYEELLEIKKRQPNRSGEKTAIDSFSKRKLKGLEPVSQMPMLSRDLGSRDEGPDTLCVGTHGNQVPAMALGGASGGTHRRDAVCPAGSGPDPAAHADTGPVDTAGPAE